MPVVNLSKIIAMNHNRDRVNAVITPAGTLGVMSQHEVEKILRSSRDKGALHEQFRRCALAVLNTGTDIDDSKMVMEKFHDFDIVPHQLDWGLQFELVNAPAEAFVDGELIHGIREHLFAVIRDIPSAHETRSSSYFEKSDDESGGVTNAVFHILRRATIFDRHDHSGLVVCWGGHSIDKVEYKYTKEVGYHLGLRGLNICTGCGPGAMKGPMKGATFGHAKQRNREGRYIGLTEPGIIAAEPPNPIVSNLVVLPDIEKRLEAFVRTGHAFILFPGGAGSAEELLYLLGILLHPENRDVPFPLVLTGPASSHAYFEQINAFIGETLGYEAQQRYKIILDDPAAVARMMIKGVKEVISYRKEKGDAFFFNWQLNIDLLFQKPFEVTHESMAELDLHKGQDHHLLAANLRKAFSGIVAGNVREEGICSVEKNGPYMLSGDLELMESLDQLLQNFVDQHRMKLPTHTYIPCYEILK